MLFIMLPFSMLSRPTKAFLKHAMGDTTAANTKAHLHHTVATVCGMARLSYTWAVCTLSIGE